MLTIAGYGPIAEVPEFRGQALVAQLFVIVLMVIGMTISLTRQQFFETIGASSARRPSWRCAPRSSTW